MDAIFIEGWASVIAGVVVFCGSVFFLMAMLMGARLAYFITASVTLSFMLIMGLIWSVNPLGPVGQLPEWDPISVAEVGEPLEGPSAAAYPDSGGWREVNSEDATEAAQAADLASSGLDSVAAGVEEGQFPASAENNTADGTTARLLEQDGELYGAVTLVPPDIEEEEETATTEEPAEPAPEIVALLQFDPGNPLGKARIFTLGTFIVLVVHLALLSMSERRARRTREATA
jgi:hypothetical protein